MVLNLVIIILTLCCISQVNGSSSVTSVDFEDYCYSLDYKDYHVLVEKGKTIRLKIYGSSLPSSGDCSIVLKASDGYSDLQAKFTQFSLFDTSTTLTLRSSFSTYIYQTDAVYTSFDYPTISSSMKTNTYLNISYVNRNPAPGDLSASVDIYIKSAFDSSSSYVSHYVGMSIGIIVVIAIACIATVVGIVVAIVCCVVKSRSGARTGGVVMAPVQTGTTATAPYPYSVPPQQLAVHPGYMNQAPPYQTLYPNGTPGTAYPPPYSQVPPNPHSQEKVEASAPAADPVTN